MTYEEMYEVFQRNDDLYLEASPEAPRDLNAFILLQKLAPIKGDVVSAAEHDKIWLEFNAFDVAAAATEEDIIFLIKHGVILGDDGEGFSMFV